ncbi:hypothetical protein MF410_23385 (plasmid) [Rhizobium sp. C104]|nr:hypothetical protein [Rhizobium sp. C104]ULJ80941.1 hypothetical protein MF410_23385 [Rhizobium sp. C104]
MPADLPGKLFGNLPRNVAPVAYQFVFLEAETLGPDDFIAAGINQLDKERRAARTIGQPRVENIGNRMAQDQLGLVGIMCDASGRMGCYHRNSIQRTKADGHVLDQRLGENRQGTDGIRPARRQQHQTGEGTGNSNAAINERHRNALWWSTTGEDLADLSQRLHVKADIDCAFQLMPARLEKAARFLQLTFGLIGIEKDATNILVIRCLAENPERRLLDQADILSRPGSGQRRLQRIHQNCHVPVTLAGDPLPRPHALVGEPSQEILAKDGNQPPQPAKCVVAVGVGKFEEIT